MTLDAYRKQRDKIRKVLEEHNLSWLDSEISKAVRMSNKIHNRKAGSKYGR